MGKSTSSKTVIFLSFFFFYFGGFIVQTFGQSMPVMDGVAEVLPPGSRASVREQRASRESVRHVATHPSVMSRDFVSNL